MSFTAKTPVTAGTWETVAADAGDAFVQLQESGAVRVHFSGAQATGNAPGAILSPEGLQEISFQGMVDGDVVSVTALDEDSEVVVLGSGSAPA